MSDFIRLSGVYSTHILSRANILRAEAPGTDGKPAGWPDGTAAQVLVRGGQHDARADVWWIQLEPCQWQQLKEALK